MDLPFWLVYLYIRWKYGRRQSDRLHRHGGNFASSGNVNASNLSDGDIDYDAGFYILKHTLCPTVLTENGFMTNEQECRWLQTEESIEAIAMTHADEIFNYLSNYQ